MDHAKLYQLAHLQKQHPDRLAPLDAVVVAYGRWQGLTDDGEAERQNAKRLLDATIDELEPEEWQKLRDFTPLIGADTIRELMSYSFKRAYDDLTERVRDVERQYEPLPPDDDTDESNAQRRERRRRRERER